jgi:hypothetical protein
MTVQYEIRVTGTLPYQALDDLDNLTATQQPVQTVLHGMMDHADLKRLLARLELFGAPIVEIRRVRRS